MAISTHKMLNDAGQDNNAVLSAADSVGTTNHYFPCNETDAADPGNNDIGAATRVTRATDIAGGVVLAEADSVETGRLTEVTTGTVEGLTVFMYGWGKEIIGAWDSPGTDDYLIMICGYARQGNDHVSGARDSDPNHGGAVSFYMGSPDYGQLKVHPYYAIFSDGRQAIDFSPQESLMDYQLTSPFQSDLIWRTAGQVYCSCAAKRGDVLEHWVDGEFKGQIDVTDQGWAAQNDIEGAWRNQADLASGTTASIGHGAYGQRSTCNSTQANTTHEWGCQITNQPIDGVWQALSPNTASGVCDNSQDILFILVKHFSDGLPDDIGEAMDKMKSEAIAGRKYIWPAWMFK